MKKRRAEVVVRSIDTRMPRPTENGWGNAF
jgi:hypothetical protein